ncbi:MAG: methylmalonyl Co-A mutase-associated GTPase MeaB [Acidobacteria bacterium]|nr:methylmalonyl Co-A mutase-associated GTPase MeaB [Acidobacteriota bacterium]
MDPRSTADAESRSTHLAERVRDGDPRAIARAMSLVEDDTAAGVELLRALFAHTGRARLIGITGPPGAGKSTLVDRLTREIRNENKRVGVLAVDPTSPFSGGAVLGDRVRMGRHFADSGVFIRSMATRGQLGGLARATTDLAQILDASGVDVVLIETVGVGQGEVDIAKSADVCVVVLAPGSGDEVQALKAGIMEIADLFVVNQSDRDGADHLVQAIMASQSLRPAEPGEWQPPILKTVATTGDGVAALWASIGRFLAQSPSSSTERRRTRHQHRLRELLAHRFLTSLEQALPAGELDKTVDRIAAREVDPYSAADALIARAFSRR